MRWGTAAPRRGKEVGDEHRGIPRGGPARDAEAERLSAMGVHGGGGGGRCGEDVQPSRSGRLAGGDDKVRELLKCI
jgi:hypothetical protein